jgi:hypothetical protein
MFFLTKHFLHVNVPAPTFDGEPCRPATAGPLGLQKGGVNVACRLPALSPYCVIGLVWRHLDRRPGSRPKVAALAEALCRDEWALRKEWSETVRGQRLGRLVTYGCLSHGWRSIAGGVKPMAATRLAGFRSHWNFNQNSATFSLRTASACREDAPMQIAVETVEAALREYDDQVEAREGHGRRGDRWFLANAS